jgi:hypothetical protein
MIIKDIISDCIFDINDIDKALSNKQKEQKKDQYGTDTTIQDCIDNIKEQLNLLYETVK